ncbi:hypothetical protein MLD38_031978 [Melastoma candidum]|uniref:Uncharacterized protein n=1 Tax=Melastoma candidum TaxID=119954 RepID=A0ACB9MRD6_9MYRT|nr:hypothetical protein MLD38_031978 [Melastoma candidum]
MALVECLDVGLTTVTKSAMSRGMSRFVFLAYSNALACALHLPVAAFLIRITAMQNCVFAGLSYSSPILVSAMANLVSAFTFILAVAFRALLKIMSGWVIGGLFLGTASFCLAMWNMDQIVRRSPSAVYFHCAIVALAVERNPKAWRVRPLVDVIPVIHSALAGNMIKFCTI